MSKFSNVVVFVVGAAVGSAVTWKLLKTKYEQIAQEEIDSVKEAFSKRFTPEDSNGPQESGESQMTLNEYSEKLKEMKYANDLAMAEKEKKGVIVDMNKSEPYVISPEEFGELDDYDAISLNYYADGVLTDDWDNVIEDVDDMVGLDSLNHFGEYEDDSVFVRNERDKADYEILLDTRNFADIKKSPQDEEE